MFLAEWWCGNKCKITKKRRQNHIKTTKFTKIAIKVAKTQKKFYICFYEEMYTSINVFSSQHWEILKQTNSIFSQRWEKIKA
jgi:hypothetical protein